MQQRELTTTTQGAERLARVHKEAAREQRDECKCGEIRTIGARETRGFTRGFFRRIDTQSFWKDLHQPSAYHCGRYAGRKFQIDARQFAQPFESPLGRCDVDDARSVFENRSGKHSSDRELLDLQSNLHIQCVANSEVETPGCTRTQKYRFVCGSSRLPLFRLRAHRSECRLHLSRPECIRSQ